MLRVELVGRVPMPPLGSIPSHKSNIMRCDPAQMSISDLKLKACKAMGLEEGDVRIWDYWNLARHALLESRLDDTAQAAKLFDNQDILLEEKVCKLVVLIEHKAHDCSTTRPRSLSCRALKALTTRWHASCQL